MQFSGVRSAAGWNFLLGVIKTLLTLQSFDLGDLAISGEKDKQPFLSCPKLNYIRDGKPAKQEGRQVEFIGCSSKLTLLGGWVTLERISCRFLTPINLDISTLPAILKIDSHGKKAVLKETLALFLFCY